MSKKSSSISSSIPAGTVPLWQRILSNRPEVMGGLAALVCFCGVFGYLGLARQHKASIDWQQASAVVPPDVLKNAIERIYPSKTTPPNPQSMRVLKIAAERGKTLYFIDFHTKNLCGVGGCLYVLYDETGKLLMSVLLRPELPQGASLVAVLERTRNGYPCFSISQSGDQDRITQNREYCHEGVGFAAVDSFESSL